MAVRDRVRTAVQAVPGVTGAITRVRAARVRWNRWRLVRAYMRVAHRRRVGDGRTSVRGGVVNHMIALDQLERDDLIELNGDGDVNWKWPNE